MAIQKNGKLSIYQFGNSFKVEKLLQEYFYQKLKLKSIMKHFNKSPSQKLNNLTKKIITFKK